MPISSNGLDPVEDTNNIFWHRDDFVTSGLSEHLLATAQASEAYDTAAQVNGKARAGVLFVQGTIGGTWSIRVGTQANIVAGAGQLECEFTHGTNTHGTANIHKSIGFSDAAANALPTNAICVEVNNTLLGSSNYFFSAYVGGTPNRVNTGVTPSSSTIDRIHIVVDSILADAKCYINDVLVATIDNSAGGVIPDANKPMRCMFHTYTTSALTAASSWLDYYWVKKVFSTGRA